MALPANVGTGTVSFNIQGSDDQSSTGEIVFAPELEIIRNVGSDPAVMILTVPTVVAYNGSGSVELIATNDADNIPLGWTYKVTIKPTDEDELDPFSITVQEGVTQNLADLIVL